MKQHLDHMLHARPGAVRPEPKHAVQASEALQSVAESLRRPPPPWSPGHTDSVQGSESLADAEPRGRSIQRGGSRKTGPPGRRAIAAGGEQRSEKGRTWQSAACVARNAVAVADVGRPAALSQQLAQAPEGIGVEREFLETQFEFADFQDPLLCFVRAQVTKGRAAAAAAQQARAEAASSVGGQGEQLADGSSTSPAPGGAARSPDVHIPAGGVPSQAVSGGACGAAEGSAKILRAPGDGSVQHPHRQVRKMRQEHMPPSSWLLQPGRPVLSVWSGPMDLVLDVEL